MTTPMSCSISSSETPALVADLAQQRRSAPSALARVEPGGRLVEAEQFRAGAQRAGDLQPALIAIGQLAGGIVGAVDQAGHAQPVAGGLDRGPLGAAR